MPTVLVIDDNPAVATALDVMFSLHDIATLRAESPQAGLALLRSEAVDLVIQDMNFTADTTSGAEGAELFVAIRREHPDLPVILLTAWTHLGSAVELVKAGAADYLAKPWDDARLLTTVNNLLELVEARRELDRRRERERDSRQRLVTRYDLRDVVFADPASERVIALACQVARSNLTVLITGPNGAGKEKIAAIIQANSAVKNGPFVTLNCGAPAFRTHRSGTVRRRSWRLHRCQQGARRQVRSRRWRHAVPRRDRQPATGRTSQAAARAGDGPLRTTGVRTASAR